MASLLVELKRRNVFRVAVAYAIVAWLIMQAAAILLPAFEAPAWVMRVVVLLLVIGFFVALILSWAYELTPEGVKRTAELSTSEQAMPAHSQKLDRGIMALLVIAVVFLLAKDYLGAPLGPERVGATTAVVAEGPTDQRRDVLPNSIAVLPLANLSPDEDNAFFALGIQDEIITRLANLRDLNVIARTSVMQYADAARPITEIAKELNVATIMEGSVSYAEGSVAVRVQLIDAETGTHRWQETYRRPFADIFEIQADIAMSIANALQARFSAAEQERLARASTKSPEAYALYLQALDPPTPPNASSQDRALAAGRLLDQAVALDPEFAAAYALKAQLYANRGRGALGVDPEWERTARAAAERALALDASLVSPHASLAAIDHANWRWADAQRGYENAYNLNPKDTDMLLAYGTFKRDIGDYEGSIALFKRLAELDPNADRSQLAISYRYARDYAQAIELDSAEAQRRPASGGPHMQIGYSEIARGNIEEGVRQLRIAEGLPIGAFNAFWRRAQMALAYSHAGQRADVERLLAPMLENRSDMPIGRVDRIMALLALREYDQARELLASVLADNRGVGEPVSVLGQIKANDYADPVLEQPEWQALRARIGAL